MTIIPYDLVWKGIEKVASTFQFQYLSDLHTIEDSLILINISFESMTLYSKI